MPESYRQRPVVVGVVAVESNEDLIHVAAGDDRNTVSTCDLATRDAHRIILGHVVDDGRPQSTRNTKINMAGGYACLPNQKVTPWQKPSGQLRSTSRKREQARKGSAKL